MAPDKRNAQELIIAKKFLSIMLQLFYLEWRNAEKLKWKTEKWLS